MPTLPDNIAEAFDRVGDEFQTVREQLTGNEEGSLDGLQTTEKGSLVAAINEVRILAETGDPEVPPDYVVLFENALV